MRTLITAFLLLACGLAGAAEPLPSLPALPGQSQDAMPPADIRVIRDLQNKAYGTPSLPTDAAKPDALLALSDLGSMAASSEPGTAKLQQEDYDALFALLQRYRDDLLKMGMDGAELQAQMESLVTRTTELERRLKDLQPRDGLKFFGRFFTAFDDLHLIGPVAITANQFLGNNQLKALPDGTWAPNSKTAGVGMRSQIGVALASISLEGTRGPVTAGTIMDMQTVWGFDHTAISMRRVYVQWRAPVTLEFGDFNANISPLTLWRNDQRDPFEPLIFQERRQRMEDDLMLKPDQWPMTGLHASTDLLLFGSTTLHVDSITGIAAYDAGGPNLPNNYDVYYTPTLKNGYLNYTTEANTYYQGWRLGLALGNSQAWTVGYDGLFEWAEMDTSPTDSGYLPMQELVQSLDLNYQSGSLSGSLAAALSSYQNPYPVNSVLAQAAAMTGTAFTADAKWTGDHGFLKVYGRYVSSGYHASGAQGRTVDYNFQISGPFLTEDSQFGVGGVSGFNFFGGGVIPDSYASRLNGQFIPAGIISVPGAGGAANANNPWRNLLNYGPGEEIDPYGAATPNRAGAGLEGDWKFFSGILQPHASAEFSSEMDQVPLSFTAGTWVKGFAMSRYRAGLTLDLEPWFNWPLRMGGGMTMTDSNDGQSDALGNSYDLSTSTMEGSIDWRAGKPWGASLAYRSMVAAGQNEIWAFTPGQNQTWDILGGGVWWRPQDSMTLDADYTSGHTTLFGALPGSLEYDQMVLRATLEF